MCWRLVGLLFTHRMAIPISRYETHPQSVCGDGIVVVAVAAATAGGDMITSLLLV